MLVSKFRSRCVFEEHNLKTRSGKQLQISTDAHLISLLHIRKTSRKDSEDFSIRFHLDGHERMREILDHRNSNKRGRTHVRFYIGEVFGSADHPKKPRMARDTNHWKKGIRMTML